MIAAVNPTGNGFGGGVLATAGRPTAVGGSFSSPGTAAGTPPGVPNSSIIEARNNRGSNVQVPYARLVPMHSRQNMHEKTDVRFQNGQLEYDGLHQGELAWILGRRFKSAADTNPTNAQGTTIPENGDEFTDVQRYSHQAFAGLGTGVDRMQRLASTGWVESLFAARLGRAKIALHNVKLDSPYAKAMDSSLQQFDQYLNGASVLRCPDIAWWRANIEQDQDKDALKQVEKTGRRAQGINIIDTSPFLRGVQVDSSLVSFKEDNYNKVDMARNQGDVLSMSVLETELRRRNIMDWTPDGIVLSKLESPTDEPMKSTEIDARQAQLFNVGVQGPSITKSWTSDVKDFRLQVLPMDKVFIVVVATLSYHVVNDNTKYLELIKKQEAVLKALYAQKKAKPDGIEDAKTTVRTAIREANLEAEGLTDQINASAVEPIYDEEVKNVQSLAQLLKIMKKQNATADEIGAKERDLEAATAKLNDCWKRPNKDEIERIQEESKDVRTNRTFVSKAYLTNFRLIRTTSSHMANYSYYKEGDENSRLGLGMGPIQDSTDGSFSQVREVIVGGWCIGTVADSAASRSTIGFQTVKSHPTSMAINVNVNVQWWGGDKMYKHYHDAGGLVMMRGKKRDLESDGDPKQPPEEDTDVTPVTPVAPVALSLDGGTRGGPFVPPMSNERSVRARNDVTGGAGTSGARPGGSRRA